MTFVIAEVGSNWATPTDIMTSIQMAKTVGADAVKFQMFTAAELYGFGYTDELADQNRGHLEISPARDQAIADHLPKMAEKAKAAGIGLMVTAFSPVGVVQVDPYVSRHKIASSDINYLDLLGAVAKTGKPVLLSTGCSTIGDISGALQVLNASGSGDVTLLYCVSAYPSREHDLWGIERLQAMFPQCRVGFSDHSIDTYTPISAVRHFNAPVIEKHFQAVDGDFPDTPHSLDVRLFKRMVEEIKLGASDHKHMTVGEEQQMRLRHNRRLVATRDIKAGDKLVYNENFGAYRSLTDDSKGLNPFMILDAKRSPNGKVAKENIGQGQGIGPGSFE